MWLKAPILLCTGELPNPDRQLLWQFCNGLPCFAVFHNFVWFCLNLETCSRLGLWIHEQWCLVKSFDLQKRISLSPKIGKEISWPSIKIYELEDCKGWLISRNFWYPQFFQKMKKRFWSDYYVLLQVELLFLKCAFKLSFNPLWFHDFFRYITTAWPRRFSLQPERIAVLQ